jgi:hypothetical protein
MALTKIFTGMEKGPEAIDANFESVNTTDSGWSSAGITYLNGFVADSSDPIGYRVVKIGGLILFMLTGYISGTGADGDVAKLPTNLADYYDDTKYHIKSTVGRSIVRNVKAKVSVSNTGVINLVTYPGTADAKLHKGDGIWIDQLSFLEAK